MSEVVISLICCIGAKAQLKALSTLIATLISFLNSAKTPRYVIREAHES